MITMARPEYGQIQWTNGGTAVASGAVVLVRGQTGIAHDAIANGETGTLYTEGVFRLPKASGDTWVQGQILGWDVANSRLTIDTSLGRRFVATLAGTNGQTTAEAAILQGEPREVRVQRTVSAGEDTANQLDVVHNFGANPTGVTAFIRTAAGVQRIGATITFPDTNTIRVAEANLAAGELVTVEAWWE